MNFHCQFQLRRLVLAGNEGEGTQKWDSAGSEFPLFLKSEMKLKTEYRKSLPNLDFLASEKRRAERGLRSRAGFIPRV